MNSHPTSDGADWVKRDLTFVTLCVFGSARALADMSNQPEALNDYFGQVALASCLPTVLLLVLHYAVRTKGTAIALFFSSVASGAVSGLVLAGGLNDNLDVVLPSLSALVSVGGVSFALLAGPPETLETAKVPENTGASTTPSSSELPSAPLDPSKDVCVTCTSVVERSDAERRGVCPWCGAVWR